MTSAAHVPRTLADPPQAGVAQLAERAREGKLVLFIGAGVSAAAPSNGPMGSVVADRLRGPAAQMMSCSEAELAHLTLEELAEKVEDSGQENLERLRQLAGTAFDFAGVVPNYGHRAIALLMREGLVRVITVNWDCAIETAGLNLGFAISPITSVASAQASPTAMRLHKVHGTATDPPTLKITTNDVDRPDTWAVAEVQAALTGGTVVFAGLATVGDYVSNPIKQTLEDWAGYSSAVRIVAPSIPSAWAELLSEKSSDHAHLASYADDFFDDLLRELINDSLRRVAIKSQNLADVEAWAVPMVDGTGQITNSMNTVEAHRALEWWRGGVAPALNGTPFINAEAGLTTLMAVSQLVGLDGDVEMTGGGRRFSTRTPKQYIEILSKPGATLREIESIAEERARQRWEDGAYDDARPITFVVTGALGRFPAAGAVPDIAGVEGVDEIDSSIQGGIQYVSVEQLLQGGGPN